MIICGEILILNGERRVCIHEKGTEHDHNDGNCKTQELKETDVTYFDLASDIEYLEH